MKQFIVNRHTTPSTPTLDEVPNEKIRVFANETALNTTLSSLDEDEIVAVENGGFYRIKTVGGVKTKVPLTTSSGLPVGSILTTYKKIQPYNYLYCDGSTFDETQYPELYLYLGTNVLPDYRECVPVGAEKNTTDIFDSTETDPSTGLPGTQSHDVFTQGQFKDDQLQDHKHSYYTGSVGDGMGLSGSNLLFADGRISGVINARTGTTTRTKEKAVYYYIKAVDGVDIADEDTFLNTVVNTIQDSQSYSTTEQKTGGKWIDGKDIYRRAFYSATNWASGTTIGTIQNIGTVIGIKDLAPWSNGSIYQNWGEGSSVAAVANVNPSTGNVVVSRLGGFSNSYPSTVIVEYTKNE